MQRKKYFYLIEIQYLGFRLHGWQKQPGMKTVDGMIQKTLNHVLGERWFKTLGGSRTDAKVSANQSFFELFVEEEPLEMESFLKTFNINLPQDIKAISIKEVDQHFNIIQQPKIKEYHYLFTHGVKMHPFAAAVMVAFQEELNIELMREACKCFEGEHDFHSYVIRANDETKTLRTIESIEIVRNDKYQASFFPEESYILKVRGKGFLRNQIRLMMGALIRVGNGELTEDNIIDSLKPDGEKLIPFKAPASGLILHSIDY